MTGAQTKTLVVERDLPFAADRIWRALTQPHLMAEWLMQTDFALVQGQKFTLSSPHVTIDCQVRQIEPLRCLSYSWDAYGLESVVTFTLTPSATGTLLRMEQAGFRPDQAQAYGGARQGWARFLERLDQVLGRFQ